MNISQFILAITAFFCAFLPFGHTAECNAPEVVFVYDKDVRTDPLLSTHADELATAWKHKGEAILCGISDILGLSYSMKTVEIDIEAYHYRARAHPNFQASVHYKANEFVSVLGHEFVHHLLIHHTDEQMSLRYQTRWSGFENVVESHVLVFSVLKELYGTVMRDEELLKCAREKIGDDLLTAWKIVDTQGHQTILRNFRQAGVVTMLGQ